MINKCHRGLVSTGCASLSPRALVLPARHVASPFSGARPQFTPLQLRSEVSQFRDRFFASDKSTDQKERDLLPNGGPCVESKPTMHESPNEA